MILYRYSKGYAFKDRKEILAHLYIPYIEF